MKRISTILVAIAVVAMALPAIAGEGHCKGTTQECLDKMAKKMAKEGWAGFDGEYDYETHLFTLTEVTSGSPAEKAGFKAGDALFAFNGKNFSDMTEEDWYAQAEYRAPGKTTKWALKRGGKEKTIKVVMAQMPEDVLAAKIGKHMMKHATVADSE